MSLAAKSVSGKILAIFFPIMAFVAMGFDHVVANMFFLPAAIFAGVPGPRLGRRRCCNWLLAGLGNLVGAVVFVATSYWYLFLKDQPDAAARRPSRSRPSAPEHDLAVRPGPRHDASGSCSRTPVTPAAGRLA